MQVETTIKRRRSFLSSTNTVLARLPSAVAVVGILYAVSAVAQLTLPDPNDTPAPTPIGVWNFGSTDWASAYGYLPTAYVGVSNVPSGAGSGVLVDSPEPAFLRFNVIEADGWTNVTLGSGGLMCWVTPNWSSVAAGGNGAGNDARLITVGNPNQPGSPEWSLRVTADGNFIVFTVNSIDILTAPICWDTNQSPSHFIALSYSGTNTVLSIDKTNVATGQGIGALAINPAQCQMAIGSDLAGNRQIHGVIARLATWDAPIDLDVIAQEYTLYSVFYMGTIAQPHLLQAPSVPSPSTNYFNAITGTGNLIQVGTVPVIYDSQVWITNLTAATATNGMRVITFTINGGADAPYDVFVNSVLSFGSNGVAWSWFGQGYHGCTYALTNMVDTAFIILGTPTDDDGDGLTTAYENLVSKTDSKDANSNLDGLLDSWEVLLGLKNNLNSSSSRSAYFYDNGDWLNGVSGVRAGSIGSDSEGNVTSVSQ